MKKKYQRREENNFSGNRISKELTFKENFGGEVIPGNRVQQGSNPNKA